MMDKYFIILREKWIMQIDTSPKLVALITLPMLMLLFRDRDVPALFQEKPEKKNYLPDSKVFEFWVLLMNQQTSASRQSPPAVLFYESQKGFLRRVLK